MRRRATAVSLIVALAVFLGGDLLAARAPRCGPHPCCAKGACKMAAKRGAVSIDRCGDDQAKTSQPAALTAVARLAVAFFASPAGSAGVAPAGDGTTFMIDRPPRG